MCLGAYSAEVYLQPQQNEQSSLMFLNILPIINQKFPGIIPIILGSSWDDDYL